MALYANGKKYAISYAKSIDTSGFATKEDLTTKQDKLTAGAGIDITDNVISATGGGGDVDVVEAIKGEIISPKMVNGSDGTFQAGNGQFQTVLEEDNANVQSMTSMTFGGSMGIWSDYQFYSKRTGETSYQSLGFNFGGNNDAELSCMTMDDYGYSTLLLSSSRLYLDYVDNEGSAYSLNISVKTGTITYSDSNRGEIELGIYDLLSAVKNIIDNGGGN